MGLSPQGAASMVGMMGETTASALPPPTEEVPTESPLQKAAIEFQGAWNQLSNLNGELGGDAELFRGVQKALEAWFADLATKLPEQPAPSQTANY